MLRNLDIATKVAYAKGVMMLCVILDGDKVNPSGEMSGGKITCNILYIF